MAENPLELIGNLSKPGELFEITETKIGNITKRVFKNIPNNLRGLYHASLDYSDETFLVYEDIRWTYHETLQRAASVAQYLTNELNVKKGDRVALASRNFPEWVVAYVATTSIGAIIVPMNSWWIGSEIEYGLLDSGAKVLFADKERIEATKPKLPSLDLTAIAMHAPHLKGDNIHDMNDLMCDWKNAVLPEVDIQPDDLASILYTSGSTGKPKGVASTHRAILSHVYSILFVNKVQTILAGVDLSTRKSPASMLLPLPLFHVTGCNVQFLPSFLVGRKLVMMYKWDAGKALELIEKEKVSALTGVPTMGQDLISHPDFAHRDTSSLKDLSSGGAPKPPEQVKEIAKKAPGIRPGSGYGLTEVNGAASAISGADYLRNPASCGKALPPLTEIKIVSEEGHDASPLEWGEVFIKGAMVMNGYWNKPEATAEVLTEDGWFKTGDIGYLDDEGFLFLVDRAKDLVIRGGENIGCAEVEGAIAENKAIMEVAVYGIPHNRLGEIVAATVMLKKGYAMDAATLKEFLSDKLAKFKIPEHIWFQQEPLPRGATEKIFKRGIRESALKKLENGSKVLEV